MCNLTPALHCVICVSCWKVLCIISGQSFYTIASIQRIARIHRSIRVTCTFAFNIFVLSVFDAQICIYLILSTKYLRISSNPNRSHIGRIFCYLTMVRIILQKSIALMTTPRKLTYVCHSWIRYAICM